jgi:hypothetical protein
MEEEDEIVSKQLLALKRRQITKNEKILFLLDLDSENNVQWDSDNSSSTPGARTRFQCVIENLEMVLRHNSMY